MPADLATLRRHEDQLWAQAQTTWSEWQTMSEFLLPRKSNITAQQSPGERQTARMFDSIGPHSVQTLAASLGGTLTSPAQQWFSLIVRQKELLDLQDVRAWLEEVRDRAYLAINQSNFTSEVAEVYVDLCAFGTGAMLVLERQREIANVWPGLEFVALAPGTFVISEGADGRVDTLYRRFPMTPAAIIERWGPAKAGERVTRLMDTKPYEFITVCHAIYPRYVTQITGPRRTSKAKRWASVHYLSGKIMGEAGSSQEAHLLEEGGYDEFPGAVPRWTKTSGETWGRGPGHTALPDIRSLNQAVKLWLQAAEKAIDPPLMEIEDSVVGELSLEPAYRNKVDRPNAITPLVSGMRPDIVEFFFARMEAKVRQTFFVDQLELKESPQMTATEVLVRQELMQRLLGPTAGRLHSELLSPAIFRIIALMDRAGQLPPVPDTLLEVAQSADIDVEYEGPLARAQKLNDLAAIERKNVWVQQRLEAGQLQVLDLFDWDEEAREVAKITGVPANIILGDEQVAMIRQAKAEAQQAAQKMQAMAAGAQALGQAAPGLKVMQEAQQPEGAAA